MLFTDYSFIGFLAVVFVLYYTLPKKCQWPFLLVASYVFYFIASPSYLIFIAATTVSTYLVSLKLDKLETIQKEWIREHKGQISREEKKEYKAGIKAKKWKWLLVCLFFNLGILAVLKYTNFTIANINGLLQAFHSDRQLSFLNLVLPMGISFYTFQTMGYIIDVYRGTSTAEKNPFKLALFVSFFPQLVQGPISRFNDLAKSLFEVHYFDPKVVSYGLYRILWGYFKKVVVADRILTAVNAIIQNPDTYQGGFVFVGMMFYAFELYADFTGGIDITIGIAQTNRYTYRELPQAVFFEKYQRILEQMAYHHGYMVYGLYFLSDLCMQADAEVLQVLKEHFRREDRQEGAGLPVFFCGMVYDRHLARRQLEFYRVGSYELCRDHDLRGI